MWNTNNQLTSNAVNNIFLKNILYIPDFVANGGGLIYAASEYANDTTHITAKVKNRNKVATLLSMNSISLLEEAYNYAVQATQQLFVKNVSNDFAIPYIQYLNTQGELLKNHTISTTVLLQLYENILFTDCLIPKQLHCRELSWYFSCIIWARGNICSSWLSHAIDDTYCPYYRDHGALFEG